MKLSTHKSKEEARKAAEKARKSYSRAIFSQQPEGWVVYVGGKKRGK